MAFNDGSKEEIQIGDLIKKLPNGDDALVLNRDSLKNAPADVRQHVISILQAVYNGPYLEHFDTGADLYSFEHLFSGVIDPEAGEPSRMIAVQGRNLTSPEEFKVDAFAMGYVFGSLGYCDFLAKSQNSDKKINTAALQKIGIEAMYVIAENEGTELIGILDEGRNPHLEHEGNTMDAWDRLRVLKSLAGRSGLDYDILPMEYTIPYEGEINSDYVLVFVNPREGKAKQLPAKELETAIAELWTHYYHTDPRSETAAPEFREAFQKMSGQLKMLAEDKEMTPEMAKIDEINDKLGKTRKSPPRGIEADEVKGVSVKVALEKGVEIGHVT